jgi:hypothetical protein
MPDVFNINSHTVKTILLNIITVLFLNISLFAQDSKIITVKAGTAVRDYFPAQVRYRYPDFLAGEVLFNNGNAIDGSLNYNFLSGEMEFIRSGDTLSIDNKKDISSITVGQDIFYYNNGYLELIFDGPFRVGLLQFFRLKDVVKKGAFGNTTRGASLESYNLEARGDFHWWVPSEDLVFQKTQKYYFKTPESSFILFTRKNILQSFPRQKETIKKYLKSDKVNFNSAGDILRLAEFLSSILS